MKNSQNVSSRLERAYRITVLIAIGLILAATG